MLKCLSKLAVIIVMAMTLTGCVKAYRDIKVTSCNVVSMAPSGLRALDIVLSVGVANPGPEFEINDLDVTIKTAGEECLHLSTDKLLFEKAENGIYRIPVRGELCEGYNVMSALQVLQGTGETLTAEASFRIGMKGTRGIPVKLKERPVSDVLKKLL